MENVKEVHIIPYSHHDHAWCNARQWHIRRYLQIFNEVLDVMRENQTFTFMIDNVLHSFLPFIKHCPERIEEFKERVKEGRIYVANGGFSLVRSTYVGNETFIRNMVAGKRFFMEMFEQDNIEFFYNADVACGHSQLPQILRLGGHRYYRFQRPDDAMTAKRIPYQFIWEGLDGTRVTVSRGSYGGFVDGQYTNLDYETEWEIVKEEFIKQEMADKVGELLMSDKVWLNYGCDDCRPLRNLSDAPISLLEFVEEWNSREQTKLVLSTPAIYFEKLKSDHLPIHHGVLDPVELSYNAPLRGNHSMWRMRYELERLLVKAEKLAVFAHLSGTPYPYEKIQLLWRQLFTITGHGLEWVFKQDFEDAYAIALQAKYAVNSMIAENCADIAAKLQGSNHPQYVVLNTLNWNRSGMVKLHITIPPGAHGFDLKDSAGNRVEYQVIDVVNAHEGLKRYPGSKFVSVDVVAAVTVPQLGHTVLTALPGEEPIDVKANGEFIDTLDNPGASASEDHVVLSNEAVEVFLEKGVIRKIKEVSTGRIMEIASSDHPSGLKFVRTVPSNAWVSNWETIEETAAIPDHWEWVEHGPLRWVYRISGSIGNSTYRQDIILHRGSRAIGFDLHLDSSGEEGFFTVEFAADADTPLHADIPFGVEERDLRNEPYGGFERAWNGQFYANSWAMYQCGGMTAAIVSEDCSIYYQHDAVRNTVSLLLNRCVPLDNKIERWFLHTHPSIEGKGVHRYKYSLFLPGTSEIYTETARYAREQVQPIDAVVKYNEPSQGQLPGKSFVEIAGDNVMVSAFHMEAGGLLLRFHETEGKTSVIRLQPHFEFKQVKMVDFMGAELDNSKIHIDEVSHSLIVEVKAWQIINLQFEQ